MAHLHFPIRVRPGLSLQKNWLLTRFLNRLESGLIETSELIGALMIVRETQPPPRLLEWCDSAAHSKRDRGATFKTGMALWHEQLSVNAYFSSPELDSAKIPIPIFEALVRTIQKRALECKQFDVKRVARNLVAQLKSNYERVDATGYCRLRKCSRRTERRDRFDKLISRILPVLEHELYGMNPVDFADVHAELKKVFGQLFGQRARVIVERRKELLALHFLCAFHQTEVGPYGKSLSKPCYLTVDYTASGHLALGLGLHDREETGLEQMLLYREVRSARRLTASHGYARPYLVTDLTEQQHMDPLEQDERIWGTLYKSALRVCGGRRGYFLKRIHRPRLSRQRRIPGDFPIPLLPGSL